MLVPIVVIGSLGAAYFTWFLYRKMGKKIAATMLGVNYIFLVLWIYYVFVVDIFGFGFTSNEGLGRFLYGREVYSYVAESASDTVAVPTALLVALAVITFLALLIGILAMLHGTLQAVNILCSCTKSNKLKVREREQKWLCFYSANARKIPLLRLYCRANC